MQSNLLPKSSAGIKNPIRLSPIKQIIAPNNAIKYNFFSFKTSLPHYFVSISPKSQLNVTIIHSFVSISPKSQLHVTIIHSFFKPEHTIIIQVVAAIISSFSTQIIALSPSLRPNSSGRGYNFLFFQPFYSQP